MNTIDHTIGVCRHCAYDIVWFPASAGSPAMWIDHGGFTTCNDGETVHEAVRKASTDMIFGRCDAAGCHGTTAYVTRGYLADGTSPTYNEACEAHAGAIAANYLTSPALVRSSIERVAS